MASITIVFFCHIFTTKVSYQVSIFSFFYYVLLPFQISTVYFSTLPIFYCIYFLLHTSTISYASSCSLFDLCVLQLFLFFSVWALGELASHKRLFKCMSVYFIQQLKCTRFIENFGIYLSWIFPVIQIS